MKSDHRTFSAWSTGICVVLLLVTGTAVMISLFSGPLPMPSRYSPAAIAPVTKLAPQPIDSDSLLYQRVVRSDGSYRWALTEEPNPSLAARWAVDPLAGIAPFTDARGLKKVNYTLVVKPAGFNTAIKNCSKSSTGTTSKAFGAYDILCHTVI